jgi:hypothetical protein
MWPASTISELLRKMIRQHCCLNTHSAHPTLHLWSVAKPHPIEKNVSLKLTPITWRNGKNSSCRAWRQWSSVMVVLKKIGSSAPLGRTHYTVHFQGVMVFPLCYASVHWPTHAYSACPCSHLNENGPYHLTKCFKVLLDCPLEVSSQK